ncbi:hypothetical protein B5X24_HaOG214112 [Helicoverpa armigera]|nr:hypothetical protein B5X24_HaOG214112 [Helicoverpa armigera]
MIDRIQRDRSAIIHTYQTKELAPMIGRAKVTDGGTGGGSGGVASLHQKEPPPRRKRECLLTCDGDRVYNLER